MLSVFSSCRHIYLAFICINPFPSWSDMMLQRNAQVQNFRHFCGILTTAFWHFSLKNSWMQSLQLSFFSVNNPWLERTVFFTWIQASPAACAASLDNQSSTVLRTEISSPPEVFEPLRNILWPLSLFLLLHPPKKEDSSASSSRRWQVASRFFQKVGCFPRLKTPTPLSVSQGKFSGHAPSLMAPGTLRCKMLHGHASKESSRKLQIPNLLKMKNCLNSGPWNIYFLLLNHIIFRLRGSVCKLFLWVGVNNGKEEKLTYPTAKYVWAGKIRFSRLICVSEKAKMFALKLKTGIKNFKQILQLKFATAKSKPVFSFH